MWKGEVKHNPELAAKPNKDFKWSDTVAKECVCSCTHARTNGQEGGREEYRHWRQVICTSRDQRVRKIHLLSRKRRQKQSCIEWIVRLLCDFGWACACVLTQALKSLEGRKETN